MIRKIAKPIILNKKNILDIAIKTNSYLKDTLYNVLINIFKEQFNIKLKLNSLEDEIKSQIKSGNLFLEKNFIYSKKGFFSSNQVKILEKLGGKYNRFKKAFYFETLPHEIIDFVILQQGKINTLANDFESFLTVYKDNIDKSIDLLEVDFLNTTEDFETQLKANLKNMGIVPEISTYQQSFINEKYTTDFKKYINNLANSEVERIRNNIQDYVLNKGYRTEKIAEILQNSYDFTQKRSLFIARQESSLLLANYQESRYKELGFNRYQWQTAHDEKVRDFPTNNTTGENHKRLDGGIFEFDKPPIVNELTGETANPGERFNCRCLARPVIE